MTIALCEDEQEIRELIEEVLSDNDNRVLKCDNIDGLVNILQDNRIDIIILDYWLKKTKADEAIQRLRAEPLWEQIPVVLISAVTNIVEIGRELNVAKVIKKPFEIEELKRTINSIR